MKVAVLTTAFREAPYIEDTVEQFRGFNIDHYVHLPQFAWSSDLENDTETYFKARKTGAYTINFGGKFVTEHDQINLLLDTKLSKYDWVIICDADERYDPENISILLEDLVLSPSQVVAVRSNNWEVYWKTDYTITPEQTDYPLIAVRPSVRFHRLRQPSLGEADKVGWTQAKMHHFSYCRTDDDMWKKIVSFEHAREFDTKAWYDNVWLKWNPDMENLHPVVPSQFKKAVWNPAPDEVRKL